MGKNLSLFTCFFYILTLVQAISAVAATPQVSAGVSYSVGLKSDGTVVAVGANNFGQCNVSGWSGITQVSAKHNRTIGLKSDKTVVAVGDNWLGQCNVSAWTSIVQISAGGNSTVGLKSNGTVVSAPAIYYSQGYLFDPSGWSDITQVSAGSGHAVGLKSDGSVVCTGANNIGQCNVNGWTGTSIIQISAGVSHTVGLRSDGTVVAVGNNQYGQCNVSGWTGITQVSAEFNHTVGLKSDGTVVAVGNNWNGQCNVSSLRGIGITQISAGSVHTVGLKSDGTVVAVGGNSGGQCNVSDWNLGIAPPAAAASDFVYPVLGISQTDPLKNKRNPINNGWSGYGVGEYSAADGHLGQDYYLTSGVDSAGEPVYSVANGEIIQVLNGPGTYGWPDNCSCTKDSSNEYVCTPSKCDHGWGPVVVIKHTLSKGFTVPSDAVKAGSCGGTDWNPTVIYSLYGHLSKESIKSLQKGQLVNMGDPIGKIGKYGVDQASWKTNHLHFELKDQWSYDSGNGLGEGAWYSNRANDGKCPEPTDQAYSVKGIGTGYSHAPNFAPHRYVPSFFIGSNMVPLTARLDVAKTGTGSGTIIGDEINCGSNCSEQRTMGTVVTLTPTPASGSIFKGWSVNGTIVDSCDSCGPCEVRLDADTVVTGTFSPAVVNPPKLSGSIGLKGWQSANVMFVNLKITNTGLGNAQNIIASDFAFKTLAGSGAVTYNTSLSPSKPVTIGNLNVGESKVITLYLNVPSTVTRFSISEGGTVQDESSQGSTYLISQTILK